MRVAVFAILAFVIALPLLAQEHDPEPTDDSVSVREEPAATEVSDEIESPPTTLEPTATLVLEAILPMDTSTAFPSDTPFFTDTPTTEPPTETMPFFPSETPTPTAVVVETEMTAPTGEVTVTIEITVTLVEEIQLTPPNTPEPTSFACNLDVDADGSVTPTDLALLENNFVYTELSEVYDLNQNGQLEIGDLQIIAGYLDYHCSE